MRYPLLCIVLTLSQLVGWAQSTSDPRGGKTSPAAVSASSGTAYGIVVGISAYQHLPQLQFANRDARVFADYLIRATHVPAAHLEVLIDQQATLVNFTDALTQVRKQVKRGDRVYLYFAGHGDIETRTDSTDNAMLMLVGAARKDYNATFDKIYLSDLKRWLDALASAGAEVIFVADACRSGAFVLAGGTLGQSRTLLGLEQEWAGQVKLLACEPGELAIEGEEFGGGRGLFSYCLVDGLMGLADGAGDNERDGMITKAELEAYLKAVVRKTARPHVQNPQIMGGEAELPLGRFNADSLRSYQQHKTRAFTLLTTTQTKGLETDLLQGRDSTTRHLYGLFDQAITARRLLYPTNGSALYYLRQLPPTGNAKLLGLMKRNLVAALQQRTDELLKPTLEKIDEYKVPPTTAKLDSAIAEIDASISLLDRDHNLLPNLKARRLYLEGNRLLYGKREKANLNDSLTLLAMRRFQESARLEPNMVYTYWAMAETGFMLMQPDLSLFYMEKCRALLPNSVVVLRTLGLHYQIRHRTDEARQVLEQAIHLDPSDPNTNKDLAEFYYKTGNATLGSSYTQKALAAIDKKFSGDDKRAKRLAARGEVLKTAAQLEKAIETLRTSLRLDSTEVEVYLSLGTAYSKQKNWTEAINTYQRLTRRFPAFSIGYSTLADVYHDYYRQSHDAALLQKARENLEKSLTYNPGNIHALMLKSTILYDEKDFQAVIPLLNQIVQSDPSICEVHMMLGSAYLFQNDTLRGQRSLLRADSLINTNDFDKKYLIKKYLGALAKIYHNNAAAEQYFRQGIALKPDDEELLSGLVGVLLDQNKGGDEALALLRRLQQLAPAKPGYWQRAGFIYVEQKNYTEALAMFKRASPLLPNDTFNGLLVGQAYLSLKQYQPAAETFEKVFRLDSTKADYAMRVARICANNLNQPDRAFVFARRAAHLDSVVFTRPLSKEQQQRFVDAVAILYAAARQPAQYEEAIYWQKRILTASPNSRYAGQYNFQIGDSYVMLNRLAEATTYLQEAVRYSPAEVNYRNLLVTTLIRANKPVEAEVEARRAARLDSANLTVNFNLAVAILRQERYAEAWPIIQRVERIAPADSWQAPYLYARWYARQGKATEALPYLETTLKRSQGKLNPTTIQTNPDFDPIRQNEGYIRLMQSYIQPTKK